MLEDELWSRGYRRVAGIDEAGRGSLAGPLVAACVVFSAESMLNRYRDSKTLKPGDREELFYHIIDTADSLGIGMAGEQLIDQVGIQQANLYAFRDAWKHTCRRLPPDYLILDWLTLPGIPIPSQAVCHAENLSYTVAAASIVAKVWRDWLMNDWYHPIYPQYGFSSHKGYGTSFHLDRIKCFGVSKAHRRSFCGKYQKDASIGTKWGTGSPSVYRDHIEDGHSRNQLPLLYRRN